MQRGILSRRRQSRKAHEQRVFTVQGIQVQPPEARTHVETTRTRILVIDDDPATLELVRSVLEANGYTCLTASSGEEALTLIRVTPGILLAISDINMPGMDGIALLGSLSSFPASHASPRVILLTAYPSIDFAVAALRLGAVDFLTKPVRPQNLLRSVKAAVERVQRERATPLSDRAALAEQAEALAAALRGWSRPPRLEGAEGAAAASAVPASEPRSRSRGRRIRVARHGSPAPPAPPVSASRRAR